MIRKFAISGTIVFFLLGLLLPVGRANPLLLLTPALPSPTDVVKIIDNLTKNDSSTTVNVKFGNTVSHGKLLVARSRVEIVLERSSRNWRGKVTVVMKVPTEVSYSVDLAEIRPEHVSVDSAARRLIITMPRPRVEDVTPLLPSVTSESDYRAARFRFLDKTTISELKNTMLLHDYQAKARAEGEAQVGKIRDTSRKALQAFLQKLIHSTNPGIRVMVR